jgi:competence protein ComFC
VLAGVTLESVKSWLNAGLGFFYPEACQLCGEARATRAEGYVCAGCRAQAQFIMPPFCDRCGRPFEGDITTRFECGHCQEMKPNFCSARSAVVARDKILDVIHRYKYQRALWFEPFLADLLVLRARPELAQAKWDWLVPIPLHPTKERQREFNQAERLARCLSTATQIPVNSRVLRRIVATRTQTRLNREERLDNVRNAFALCPGVHLNGERLVLLDDVFTTGATANACARVLRTAGAGSVCVWTVARGA